MAIEALEEGIQWNFQTFPEYLSMIEQQGVGPNVAVYIGHSALRTYVMGADATTRAANDDEIDAMRGLVAEAMNVGALGFSSSTHEQHVGWGGVPMPSRLRSEEQTSELQSLMSNSNAVFCWKKKKIKVRRD